MTTSTIFSDFLTALGVRHTADYSDRQFATMTFPTLFGFTQLLQSYGVDSEGYRLEDPEEIVRLTAPFIAQTSKGFVIVTSIDATANSIGYLSQDVAETMPLDEFKKVWTGVVLLAFPQPQACEPDYTLHRRMELIESAKRWVLAIGAVALFVWLFISGGLYRSWSTIALCVVDLAGLWLCLGLVQKTLKIKNKAADRVCGVLEEGGCDRVLELKASSFFGIFKWSEVGFSYFSVSLLCLLIFPQYTSYLAAVNVCCLPFTVWSIWYQKFRAHIWCTLCVSVQTCLWLQFFCYFFGGWYAGIFPLRIEFFVLCLTYLVVLLALNRLLPRFDNNPPDPFDNETDTPSAT